MGPQGGGLLALGHLTYRGVHLNIFESKIFLLSLIHLGQKKIFSKSDNSGLKLTKKSLVKTIARNSYRIWYHLVRNLQPFP